MIKFYVEKNRVSMDAKCIKEFQENVMTTKEIVDRIGQFYKNSDKQISNETLQMLTLFFNDPARRSLSITEPLFDLLNYGYGIVDNKLCKIIMWQDESGLHNFAMYEKNAYTLGGKIVKIWVENNDIFCKNQMEAALYLAKQQKKESTGDNSVNADYEFLYKSKIDKFDEELRDIETEIRNRKDKMKETYKQYIELCHDLYRLEKDKIKLNKDKTLFIHKNNIN